MDLYFALLKKPTFTPKDVEELYRSKEGARSALARLLKEGKALKIRNGLYTCLSGESLAPVATRFQIASSISPTSYLSHHSAMEYYGLYEQVYYEVHVSSKTPFREFSFDGYGYRYIHSKFEDGVIAPPLSGGIRISDLERTTLDCLKDMDRLIGVEETMKIIEMLPRLDERKLLAYLPLYENVFLYQKAGFFLYPYKMELGLSPAFFEECRRKVSKSKRYLTSARKEGYLDKDWGLVIPKNLDSFWDGGRD